MEEDVETARELQAAEEQYQRNKWILSLSDEDLERYNATDRDGNDTRSSRYRTCRSCGQSGYAGQYPFSTLGGATICDDCV